MEDVKEYYLGIDNNFEYFIEETNYDELLGWNNFYIIRKNYEKDLSEIHVIKTGDFYDFDDLVSKFMDEKPENYKYKKKKIKNIFQMEWKRDITIYSN